MRIGDQLELVAKLTGQKDKAMRQVEVRSLMEDLGIEASYAKYPRQMSGAKKQRAAIALPSSATSSRSSPTSQPPA